MTFIRYFFGFFLTFCFINFGTCYLPVICIAGFTDTTDNLKTVRDEIAKLHPGTKTKFLRPGGAIFSVFEMWTQVAVYKLLINEIFKHNPDGVHILAHSQGSLIARAIIETTSNHPVKNFLSIAGPFMGEFGLPPAEEKLVKVINFANILHVSRHNLYTLLYSKFVQETLSAAGYWNDPTKQELFLKSCKFLPYINNMIDHSKYTEFRNNFLRLNGMVMVGGDGDEVIKPWQSEFAGYYDENLDIVPMEKQYIYANDSFGLRTLDERGGLTKINISGVLHNDFVHDLNYTRDYYINYLY